MQKLRPSAEAVRAEMARILREQLERQHYLPLQSDEAKASTPENFKTTHYRPESCWLTPPASRMPA